MFQIELLDGGIFTVYAADPQTSSFLIFREDKWEWINMKKCKPRTPYWLRKPPVEDEQPLTKMSRLLKQDMAHYDSKSRGAIIFLKTNTGSR